MAFDVVTVFGLSEEKGTTGDLYVKHFFQAYDLCAELDFVLRLFGTFVFSPFVFNNGYAWPCGIFFMKFDDVGSSDKAQSF